jgi:DNA-binding response OmpR family regulator
VIQILNAIDDIVTRALVTNALQQYGMSVTSLGRQQLARHLDRKDLDLIILDFRQDRTEKLGLLRQILSVSIPVIITDDDRCATNDRVFALELGADDYLIEPIAPRELVARIRSILRRRGRARQAKWGRSERRVYRFGDLTLDLRTRRLTRIDGERIILSSREFALLFAFLDNPSQVLSREQLLTDRSIDVLVLRLRRKLETTQRLIETTRGVGYKFTIAIERL